jgi:hypothetical protein
VTQSGFKILFDIFDISNAFGVAFDATFSLFWPGQFGPVMRA